MWAGVAILVTAVVIVAVKFASPSDGPEGDGVVKGLEAVSESDWVRGASTSTLTLIEYSDFQCPACASYHPLIEQVVNDYANSMRFVYRHFPLPQHKQAKSAAYAAEAAGKQGKFWEMYNILFEKQTDWAGKSDADTIFESYAESLGLNMEQYRADAESTEVKNRVDSQYRSGVSAQVNSTPTFFLNGKKLSNPSSYESFKKLLDAAVATSS